MVIFCKLKHPFVRSFRPHEKFIRCTFKSLFSWMMFRILLRSSSGTVTGKKANGSLTPSSPRTYCGVVCFEDGTIVVVAFLIWKIGSALQSDWPINRAVRSWLTGHCLNLKSFIKCSIFKFFLPFYNYDITSLWWEQINFILATAFDFRIWTIVG